MIRLKLSYNSIGPRSPVSKNFDYDDCMIFNSENSIFSVGDGLGSHPVPEEASCIAQAELFYNLKKYVPHFKKGIIPEQKIKNYIGTSIKKANLVLYTLSENIDWFSKRDNEYSEKKRAGSTISVCYVLNNKAYIGNVGDSSIHLLRGNELINLTSGKKYETEEEESLDKLKAIRGESSVGNFIGEKKDIEPFLDEIELQHNDTILMSTDGLTKLVYNNDIIRILQDQNIINPAVALTKAAEDPSKIADYISKRQNEDFLDIYNHLVGSDSITVITIKVEGG